MTLADLVRPSAKIDNPVLARIEARSARVISVWGSAASGKTTVALNLGFEFASMDMRVLIVDADSYHPSMASHLGFTEPGPGITAVLRLARSNRLTQAEVLRLTEEIQFGSKSIHVLTGLNSPSRWRELDADALENALQLFREQFDVVVLDLASELEQGLVSANSDVARNASTRSLIEFSDFALGVFGADSVGINRFLWDCREVDFTFWPIANRVRSSTLGKNAERQLRDTMHRLLRVELRACVPEDANATDSSLLRAEPLCLCAKGSKAREAIRHLALDLLDADL
ncbi:MAG: AAA family ATPase [Aquiluna sp.]|nr:AAA family ATPase [Aquiluna sp.]